MLSYRIQINTAVFEIVLHPHATLLINCENQISISPFTKFMIFQIYVSSRAF